MSWSPDGRLIAASAGDTVKLLHSDTGEVATVLPDAFSVAFSFDGNGVATTGASDAVRFWNVRDGRLIFTRTNYPGLRVTCSPTGPLMAIGTGGAWSGDIGGDVYLVDTQSGEEVRILPQGGDRAVFSLDGKRIVTANGAHWSSGQQAVILWDVDSGKQLRVVVKKPQVLGMAFSQDGSLLAIGTRYGEITLWNFNDFSHVILRPATQDYINSVAFSPDGQWLAAALQTHEVEIWNVPERRQVERLRGHAGEVNAVGYSPDGTQLASGSLDGTIRIWKPHPQPVAKLIPDAVLQFYFGVGRPRFSPDSRWLAAGITNGDVHIVDPTTADWNVRMVLPDAGLPVAFSGDAATLLTLTTDRKTLQRWNVTSGAKLATTTLDSTNTERWGYAATTRDGGRLALATDNLIEVFETPTGRCVGYFKGPVRPMGLEFSPDEQFLATGGRGTAVLWNIAEGRIVREFPGHQNVVSAVGFSPGQTS